MPCSFTSLSLIDMVDLPGAANACCLLPLAGLLVASLVVPSMATAADDPHAPWLAPCADGSVLSIDALYAYCGVPGDCSKPAACAEHRCRVKGFIDPVNISDKQQHPWLPESKFLLLNATRDLNLEVRVLGDEAPRFFATLAGQSDDWTGAAVITGTLVGLDLPMMSSCRRAFVLNLSGPGSLVLGDDGDAGGDPK